MRFVLDSLAPWYRSIIATISGFPGSSPSRDHYSIRLDRGTGLI